MKREEVKAYTVDPLSPHALGEVGDVDSFRAALIDCERDEVRAGKMRASSNATSRRDEHTAREQLVSGALKRAWVLLQARYKTSTTKRLRLSETISLGEKRFVAIVAVEGREFLIGGGASGVSLLAQLGSGSRVTNDLDETRGNGGGVS